MSEGKHTPGPWQVKDTNSGLMILAEPNGYILELRPKCRGIESLAANARLIAAAPETLAQRDALLAAAEKALYAHTIGAGQPYSIDEICDSLRAAIASAKP